MCFIINKSKARKPKVAKEDILVYKVLKNSNRGPYYSLCIDGKKESWTRGYLYYIKDCKPFQKEFSLYWDLCYINGECFHSCKTIERAERIQSNKLTIRKIVEMIIPKGSLYYDNGYEYVSNQLLFPEK